MGLFFRLHSAVIYLQPLVRAVLGLHQLALPSRELLVPLPFPVLPRRRLRFPLQHQILRHPVFVSRKFNAFREQ